MESQIIQAVDIAFSATNDQVLKQQAFDFINQIKSSQDGWQHCMNLLNNSSINPNVKYFSLQVIDERLPFMTPDQRSTLKDFLFNHLQSLINANNIEAVYLRNGLSKTFGLLFIHSCLSGYQFIIRDFIALMTKDNDKSDSSSNKFNSIAVDYYLRTLLYIHSEIGDNLILRDRETVERNNLLKDSIRANDMVNLASSWKEFLSIYSNPQNAIDSQLSNEILQNTILCIGSYVSWIEINLILDETYMSLLYQFLASNNNSHKISSANTFNEILNKKMPPMKKIELINFLNLTTVLNQMNVKKILDYDVNVAFAKLVDSLGSELVRVLDTSSNEELNNVPDFKDLTISKILEVFPLMFDFLENEFDDISIEVFNFISNFLLFLKKNITNDAVDFSRLSNDEILTTLLKKIIFKMKYDDEDDGDDDDTIEQFSEIRGKLNSFHDSIFILNETLALDIMINCINDSLFTDKKSQDWRTVELGLYEMTHYSEILRNNVMNLPKTMINNSRPYFVFNEMLCKVIDKSQDILINHPLIQLLFFELILKHYSFFINSNIQVEGVDKSDILLKVLKIFVSNIGVFSDSEKVKLRSWFLFYRFIKLTRPTVDDYVTEELIKSLLPLLNFDVIQFKSQSPQSQSLENIDLAAVEDGNFDNQLYLFESIGLLISITSKPELRISMIETVLQPLFSILERCINNMAQINLTNIIQVHHSLIAIGTLLKGFENIHESINEKYYQNLQQISQVVLITLENFINFNIVRESTQFCIVRLFIILSKQQNEANDFIQEMLSRYISIVMMNFAKLKTLEISSFIHFISQVNHHCNKSQSVYMLLNSLITPLFNKIFVKIQTGLSDAQDDFERQEIVDLQKNFINLLIGVSNDHLNSLYLQPENQEILTTIINTMLNYSISSQDTSVVKLSLSELSNLVQGLGTSQVIDPEDIFKNPNHVFSDVDQVLIQNSLLLCMELSFKSQMNLKDAQYRNNVLLEIYRLLKSIAFIGSKLPEYNNNNNNNNNNTTANTNNNNTANNTNTAKSNPDSKCNEVMCSLISQTFTNNLGFTSELSNEFVNQLIICNDRQFLKFFIPLIEKFRG